MIGLLPITLPTLDSSSSIKANTFISTLLSVDITYSNSSHTSPAPYIRRSVDETNFGIVYTDSLCEAFDGDEVITLDLIKEKVPEVDQTMTAYKLKPRGRMTKALTIDCDAFTLGAAKMVALTGGKLLSPSDKESEE